MFDFGLFNKIFQRFISEYFEEWKTTPYSRLAPFGTGYYDTTEQGVAFVNLDIDFPIHFYGRTYMTATVSFK